MIKKIICLLWGCQFKREVYDGTKITQNGYEHLVCKPERLSWCPRCGKDLSK